MLPPQQMGITAGVGVPLHHCEGGSRHIYTPIASFPCLPEGVAAQRPDGTQSCHKGTTCGAVRGVSGTQDVSGVVSDLEQRCY